MEYIKAVECSIFLAFNTPSDDASMLGRFFNDIGTLLMYLVEVCNLEMLVQNVVGNQGREQNCIKFPHI